MNKQQREQAHVRAKGNRVAEEAGVLVKEVLAIVLKKARKCGASIAEQERIEIATTAAITAAYYTAAITGDLKDGMLGVADEETATAFEIGVCQAVYNIAADGWDGLGEKEADRISEAARNALAKHTPEAVEESEV